MSWCFTGRSNQTYPQYHSACSTAPTASTQAIEVWSTLKERTKAKTEVNHQGWSNIKQSCLWRNLRKRRLDCQVGQSSLDGQRSDTVEDDATGTQYSRDRVHIKPTPSTCKKTIVCEPHNRGWSSVSKSADYTSLSLQLCITYFVVTCCISKVTHLAIKITFYKRATN